MSQLGQRPRYRLTTERVAGLHRQHTVDVTPN